MKAGTLKKYLSKFHDDVEVVIDHDENGWFNLEDVKQSEDGEDVFVNLVSSNES